MPTRLTRARSLPLPQQVLLALGFTAASLLLREALLPTLGQRAPFLPVFLNFIVLLVLVRPGPFLAAAALGGGVLALRLWQSSTAPLLDMVVFGTAAAATGLAAWLSARALDREQALWAQAVAQRDMLRVTLASIGDAVISTNAAGEVAFMNQVACDLTGWPREEAQGRPLHEVFRLLDDATRAPLPDPAATLLQGALHAPQAAQRLPAGAQAPPGAGSHHRLLRRDGSDCPIDDNAAVIRTTDGSVSGLVLVFRDVTERRAAERTIAESEQELAEFFESASIGLQWVTADGRILRANSAQLELLGATRSQVLGQPLARFHDGGDPMAELLAPLVAGAPVVERTVRLRRVDGRTREVLVRASPRFSDGRFVHARIFTLDLTALRRAELQQRESEQRFRVMADTAPVLVWMAGPDMRCTWFNRPWLRFTGRSMEQEMGHGWLAGMHDEDLQRCLRTYAAAAAARRPFTVDCRMRRHDGAWRWLVNNGAPRLDGEGALLGYVGSCIDITDRKESETALARSEALFRRIADANLVGVGFGDSRGHVTYINDEMLRMMGRSRADFEAGRIDWAAAVAPEFTAEHERLGAELRRLGTVNGYQRAFLKPEGSRTPYVGAAALIDPADTSTDMHVSIALDLSHIQQAEQARAQLVAQLRDADRRKDEFLATLAHELRNPLAPVVHALALLSRPAADAALQAAARTTIDRQLRHMVRLIDDLLDVSRITQGRLRLHRGPVALASVLEQAVEAVRPALVAAGQTLQQELTARLPWLHGDPVRLAQVFSNLLGNAVKYSPPGSAIVLRVQLLPGRAGPPDGEPAGAGSGSVQVAVEDSGLGMSAELLPRIFEMFTQGPPAPGQVSGGLGIGLALAQRLVQLHGGTLAAHSEGPGRGSRFTVELPLPAELPQAPLPLPAPVQAAPAPAPARAARGWTLLVVDDNVDAACTLATLLGLEGHLVHVAHDGLQALQMAEQTRPQAVLLDIGLPLLDGHGVARRLRQRPWAQELLLVALTGWGQPPDRQASQQAGFDLHLVKPVALDALLQVLAERLGATAGA